MCAVARQIRTRIPGIDEWLAGSGVAKGLLWAAGSTLSGSKIATDQAKNVARPGEFIRTICHVRNPRKNQDFSTLLTGTDVALFIM